MARPLSQILTELNSVYSPQKDLYNQQINTLDPQMQADQQGLEAQKADSFGQITAGANRRGLLFSGIPLQEQASYVGQSFLPAVANLKAKYAQQRFNLQDAISKITQDQYIKGQDIYQTELNRDSEDARARAAAGGLASPSFGGAGGAVQGVSASSTAVQRADKGFNFTDAAGKPINAAVYAAQKGIPFRALLQQMANAGDAGAKAALGFVGNDYNADPRKIKNQAQANLYRALTGRSIGAPKVTTVGFAGGGGGGGGW